MSEFKASGFSDEFGSSGPDIVGITTMTSPYYFVPPSGSTAERPSSPPPGMLRFNTDIGRLEVWRNDHWATILGESPNLGNQLVTNSAGGTGVRGLTGGGYVASKREEIDYFTISTLGNAQDFGDLSEYRYWISSCSSTTRGLWGGGGVSPTSPNKTDKIDYVTIASTGDAIDFGNLTVARYGLGACANSTRGLFGGGYAPPGSQVDTIDFITIASTGDAVDFGDLTYARYYLTATASSTRGVFLSGRTGTSPYTYYDTIDYVTISSQGNAQDFGNLTANKSESYAAANPTRGVCVSGYDNGTATNSIEFITIATTGNSQDFGDLTGNIVAGSAASSPTRAVFVGGLQQPSPGNTGTMQFVTIATTGNANDFGDMNIARYVTGSCSNGHGGL
jgi:hypothetical protein